MKKLVPPPPQLDHVALIEFLRAEGCSWYFHPRTWEVNVIPACESAKIVLDSMIEEIRALYPKIALRFAAQYAAKVYVN
jgi:hypothetical protein